MTLDKFSNPIFDSEDIFNALYEGKTEEIKKVIVTDSEDITRLESVAEFKFIRAADWSKNMSVKEFDRILQEEWLMPDEYKNLDIENHIINICPTETKDRVIEELQEFKNRNMYNLLRWLKFFVDNCEKHNILWGVGRGSSVSSYVLYLLGVHNIDPIKYNLDWHEFLR